ncbi:spermidine/spermine N(1)-acetyltransferase-like protein 1 [Bicyclus anynana]|uniref:Spermidine/spermine N(1)-acetyltransferase-like protein 1 n=1 Tax=Bicyclus anynana TaxID=110368 RepID=A0A6J1MWD8_BICAN|nr:spermidine/spermine N(1)-acetyltransferase-like protein 1 [Bicyclus anynana]
MEVNNLLAVLPCLLLAANAFPASPDQQNTGQNLLEDNSNPVKTNIVLKTNLISPQQLNQQEKPPQLVGTLYQEPNHVLVGQQNQPAINQPATNQPAINQPATNQPLINQPAINQPNQPAFVLLNQPPPHEQVFYAYQQYQPPLLVSQPSNQPIWLTSVGPPSGQLVFKPFGTVNIFIPLNANTYLMPFNLNK